MSRKMLCRSDQSVRCMADEIFILTTGPIERLGGMERFLQYVASGFQERGYGVRVFHPETRVLTLAAS